ncbi:Ig-like domain-containing protein [Anaerocolumna chitinilytica]|uniref:BIG2 domain-containing protein n=1 Tax=Anaerocolumna chitinilytica TaxID=1727145 RepID=A0A7M3SAH1_9FIRM|nr:Ig-like domain-containing protein [Anaerocolumna chitinilytica]BCK01589.1 hypothetical protein bsdcttw_46290 [Anaerocolumna chitinilytica]
MKRFLSILLIMALCILAFPINAYASGINKQTLFLNSSETYTLKITGVSGKVTWKSSDESIATISKKGVVTPVSVGFTNITGTVKGVKYECDVTVTSAKKDYTFYEDDKVKAIYKGISNENICFEFINKTNNFYFLETTDFNVDGTLYYKNHTAITFYKKTDNYFMYKAKIDKTDIKNISGTFNFTKDNKKVFGFDYSIDIE